jgi:trafficking protein particle complex subunit 9
MPMYSAATWALEGFCDSLAYEIAPFNIKVTIVQPNQEIQSLTNRLIFTPQIPAYSHGLNPAPNIRDILANVLNTDPSTALPEVNLPEPIEPAQSPESSEMISTEPESGYGDIQQRYVRLQPGTADRLVTETVQALAAIGGHENPPNRHIVGSEGAIAVKEKLKTVSEEMEDFVDASLAVDIFDSELKAEAREGENSRQDMSS